MIKKTLLAAISLVVMVHFSIAQSGFGTLQGRVTDAKTGEPLAFANVVLYMSGIQKGGGQTNIDGNFTIRPVNPGTYDILVSYVGYVSQKVVGYPIGADKISFQNFALSESVIVKEMVEIKDYVKPLVEKDEGSGGRVTDKEIQKAPVKSVDAMVNLTAGVIGNSIKGGRISGTVYYVDGVRVIGSIGVPPNSMQEINTITGGVPAEYGDLIGGVVSITTRGPSSTYQGGLEILSSQLTDPFGYNNIEGNLSGPILLKDKRAKGTDSARAILGFLISANFNYIKDPIENANGFWKVKDDVYDNLYNNPISASPNGIGFVSTAEYITKNDMEHVKVHPKQNTYSYNASGKLDFQPTQDFNISLNGQLSSSMGRGYNYNTELFDYREVSKYRGYSNMYRGYIRMTQKLNFGNAQSEENKKSSKKLKISNAFYSLGVDYTNNHSYGYDENLKKNVFEYGYLGKFERYQAPIYIYDYDTIDGKIVKANRLVAYADTLVTFQPSDINQGLANYTSKLYQLNNNRITSFDDIKLMGGLLNGDFPPTVYSLWTNVSSPYAVYNFSNQSQVSVKGQASADLNNHSIKIGFEYEQRTSRAYNVSNDLWTTMRQEMNAHIQQLDTKNPIPVIRDGVFLDTINYNRLYEHKTQTTFDTSFRNYLKSIGAKDVYGRPIDDYSMVFVDRYSPDYFTLDMFSPDEVLKNGIVGYYGYDYLGNRLKTKPSLDDFLNPDTIQNRYGVKFLNRLIAPYNPIYMGGYIQDQFVYKDIIFRLGLRIDRFDANQPVLKDKYSLYPIRSVAEVTKMPNGTSVTHPGNIGGDYAVYVDDPFNPTTIIGYRSGDQWYDANGAEVSDPSILANKTSTGTISPYLEESNKDNLKLTKESFKDYEPQINFSPRIYFSFPISEQANFYADYDVRNQRPDANNFATIDDYYYLEERGTAALANAALKPQRITSYEVGFKQALSKNSSISLNAFYNETRNMVQARMINQAYPRSYQTWDNIDFSTTKGFSLTYDLRKTKINNLSLLIAYTLQFANGTGSNANSQVNLISSGQPNLRATLPLDNDYRHYISGEIDYRYKGGPAYNGPITGRGKKILEYTGVNFRVSAQSGKPYSKQANVTEDVGIGIRQSSVLKGTVNGARYPWTYGVDMKVDRDFYLSTKKKQKGKKNAQPNMYLNVYVQVQNLFNLQTIASIYRYTGTPNDDGFLSSSYGATAIEQATVAEAFRDQYQVKVDNPGNYSTPRLIRIGASINF